MMQQVEELLAEIRHLSAEDLERVKAEVIQRETQLNRPRPRTAEEWETLTRDFLDDFWADTNEQEKEAIIEAIREKNKSPKKDG